MTNRAPALANAAMWDNIYASGRAQRYWPSEDVVRFCSRRVPMGAVDPKTGQLISLSVLEAGCGNGANLWYLCDRRYRVLGVDTSLVALAEARAFIDGRFEGTNIWETATLQAGDIRTLRSQSDAGQFDAIIDCRSSQHLLWSEHQPTYEGYARLLKPGGWLFLLHLNNRTRPDATLAAGRHATEYMTWANVEQGVYANNGQVCMPDPMELVACVNYAGLAVQRIELLDRIESALDSLPVRVAAHVAIDARKL